MGNPQPTGTGECQGLDAAQVAGTPLPGRTARSEANDAANKIRDDAVSTVDAASALTTEMVKNPWEIM
jgi:hypothetical protein